MPIVPIDVDNSTVAITSIVSGVITLVFFLVHEIPFGFSAIVAIVVGVALYSFGVIPIGILVVVGFAMVVGILKALFKGGSSKSPPQ